MSGEVQAIVDTTYAAAGPRELDPETRYAVVVPGADHESGHLEIIEPQPDQFRETPRRPSGTTVVYDVDSLKVLWEKHSLPFSEVFGDPERFVIHAVLNADQGASAAPGFRDHRLELVCKQTPAWLAWNAFDGKMLEQREFAEFIEERVSDIVEPTGADMLELAQSFEATTSAQFKSATVLSSGQRSIQYEETIAAKAGQTGTLEIPKDFVVGLIPFEGMTEGYRVTARFRYRLRNGHLSLGFKLDRPEDVIRNAFLDRCRDASEATGSQVIIGRPAGPRS